MAKRKYPKLMIVTLDNADVTLKLRKVAHNRRASGKKPARWGK